jgi:hypothetical protein
MNLDIQTEPHAKLTIRTRLGRGVDPASTRYALGNALVTPIPDRNDTCLATTCDGRIMAIVECDGATDREYLVPGDLLPAKKNADPRQCELNGHWTATPLRHNVLRKAEAVVAKRVDPAQRFPSGQGMGQCIPYIDPKSVRLVTIDPALLQQLADCLNDPNTKGITLVVPKPKKGRQVESSIGVIGDAGIGVIMPLDPGREDGELSGEFCRQRVQFVESRLMAERNGQGLGKGGAE